MNYLVQLLGFLGLSASVAAFQCKKHKTIVLLRTLNELVFGLQYFFLGAYTGLAMNLIGSVRNILFTRQVEKGRSTKSTMVIFSVLFAIFGLLTWQGMKSLMIVAAKVVSTVAYGNKNPAVVRVLVLLTNPSDVRFQRRCQCSVPPACIACAADRMRLRCHRPSHDGV